MADIKLASTDHPIQELFARRWSPYFYETRSVPDADLRAVFEAARWAPSSYNEQPWRFIVADRRNAEEFGAALGCLWDANKGWAQSAPILIFGVYSRFFALNGTANRAAEHDLGLATENLILEATARGLHAHPMIGVHPDKVKACYGIPDGYETLTALALGYKADPSDSVPVLKERDSTPRTRKRQDEFVFSGKWNAPAVFKA